MNSEDNIFDIFDGVLSNENDFSSFFTNSPLPEHSEPMHEDIAPMLSIPQATTEPQQTITEPQPSIVLQPSETAQCMWAVQNVRQDVNPAVPAFVLIKVRSRDEDEIWNSVPESMYSSIRYTMTISIDPSALPVALTPLLMAQVRVVDEHGVEIKKENGESVIKGPKEFQNLDLNKDNGRLECDITIKWQSVSFHHAKRKFAFLVSFFDFADGHMQLLFEARSASFLTYARRPKVGDRVKKALAPVNTAVCKKRKTTPKKKEEEKSVQFQNFTEILDKLVGLQESLPEQERPLASQLIREKLLKEGLSIVDQL